MGRKIMIAHAGSIGLASAIAEMLADDPGVEIEMVEPVAHAIEMRPHSEEPYLGRMTARRDRPPVPKPKDQYRQRRSGKRP